MATPFDVLRQSLLPRGASEIVRLEFQDKYFKLDYVRKVIDQLETDYRIRQMGLDDEAVSDVHRMVMLLLIESAGYTAETFKKEVENAHVD